MSDPASAHPAEDTLRANRHITDVHGRQLLTADECTDVVTAIEAGQRYAPGWSEGPDDTRVADLIEVDVNDHLDLFGRIVEAVSDINERFHQLDLQGLIAEDPPQLIRYTPSSGPDEPADDEAADGTAADDGTDGGAARDGQRRDGWYDWHVDHGVPVSTRKMSYSLQLTDPQDYVGCNLEIGLPVPRRQARTRGHLLVFPSHLAHRVTPITSGVRKALVGWVHGPALR